MCGVKKSANFAANLAKLMPSSVVPRVAVQIRRGLQVAALNVQRRVVKNLKQGRSEWPPLNPMTLVIRQHRGFRGGNLLVESGTLSRRVSVEVSGFEAFIGILRTAKSGRGARLVPIAVIQERGFTISVTPPMRGFFFAHGFELSPATRTLRVPPRPFLLPALEESKGDIEAVFNEVRQRVISVMGA